MALPGFTLREIDSAIKPYDFNIFAGKRSGPKVGLRHSLHLLVVLSVQVPPEVLRKQGPSGTERDLSSVAREDLVLPPCD